jgi:tRNA threonylcarbamoyladenosine biosynthesis protein TsaE
MLTIHTHTPEETIAFGTKIGCYLKAGDVLALEGTLAAGKTTLTKGIARALGITETVTSPTFTIVSEYEGASLPFYHIDVYRLDSAEDFSNIGAEELLYGKGVCVIEWSEKVRQILPAHTVTIRMEAGDDGSRVIRVSGGALEKILTEALHESPSD